jgi:hypothetical protein
MSLESIGCTPQGQQIRLTWFDHARARQSGKNARRYIMGDDKAALLRLWKEKRGEIEPEDLSGNLIARGLAALDAAPEQHLRVRRSLSRL